MADRFVATAAGPLFAQLVLHLPTWRRNTLRERLRRGCVVVDGAPVRAAGHPVAAGAVVEVRPAAPAMAVPPGGALPLLFADDDLAAIDKPAGLLAVASDDERERTALARLRAQLGGELWPAHRLDRETSGVLLFARTRAARDAVQAAWARATKTYVAVVEGRPEPPDGVVDAPLWQDTNLRVRVGAHPDARPARTRYRTRRVAGDRAELEVGLETGRKHQIRVHLAWLGHPVVGDDRYGTAGPRLGLHAHLLSLPHPRDGRRLELVAPVPAALRLLLPDGPTRA